MLHSCLGRHGRQPQSEYNPICVDVNRSREFAGHVRMSGSGTLTRRRWLKLVAAGGSAISLGAGSAKPQFKLDDIRVISNQPELYHGWPTIARRASGELLLVCSGGREAHVCPFGRVELMRSGDGGETWSFPRVVLDGPIDDRDAGVLETARGSILVTTFTSLAYEPVLYKAAAEDWPANRLRRWQAAHGRLDAAGRRQALGVWMTRSTDGGMTFSGRYRSVVNSPHGPIQLADGRLLYAGKQLWSESGRVGFAQSTDDGQSWSWLATLPTRPGDAPSDYHELHAVETESGRLIAHIRNHNPRHQRETLQTESEDGGKTWAIPHSIGVWGLPSHLLRLADGRLLMSYGHRRPPYGNQVRLSSDQGRSWSDAWQISSDGIGGDLGYPSTVELDDRSLLTVWYERLQTSPRAVLRQARWRFA